MRGGTVRGTSRVSVCIPALALLLGVVGCAPEPVADWVPPQGHLVSGVTLADDSHAPAAAPDPESASAPVVGGPTLVAHDSGELGLIERRLRNDASGVAARYVVIPGVPAFNAAVDQLVWAAIQATGVPYSPQAYGVEAGLADRGCVVGSASWAATEVLSRPETAPPGGAGTAVTCDVTAAFGQTLLISFRTVTGGPAGVTGDTLRTFVVHLGSGAVTEGMPEWSPEAPAALRSAAVELLRHDAGALSTAPLADPDEAQLALAQGALATAAHPETGGLLVTLPAGLTSPELEGLGVGPTAQPLQLSVDAATADAWASAERRELLAEAGQPFAGVPAGTGRVPVDCALLPCVALTYDDGPSAYTSQLLDTLAAQHATATFYMIGGLAAGRPEVVARAVAEGHELGSHTMNHRTLTKIPFAEAAPQVRDAAALLGNLSGQPVATYRPPYGEINAEVQATIGMPAVLWSIDTNDWRKPGEAALFERAVLPAQPGSIVLFHDTHADTVNAAGTIITGLYERGFETATVSELFGGAVPTAIVRRG